MKRTFCLTISLACAALLSLPMPGISASLDQRIDQSKNKIAEKRAKEQVLTTQISSYQVRIRSLQGDIRGLQVRQDKVQVDLDAKQAELQRISDELQRTRDHLTRLKARLEESKDTLADRLVALYKDDEPDMVTVVLEADGFTDLLDRAAFVERISQQDDEIITRVRDLTAEVGREAKRLAELEHQARVAAEAIQSKRDEIAAAKETVVSRQAELVDARDVRAGALDRIAATRREEQGHLDTLEAKQSEIVAARLRASNASSGVTAPDGPIKRGSGNFIWPVNGPIVSPFGMRWGRLHAGVDIAVPSGTPVHAAAAGTVQLASPTSGYGNYVCIAHGGGISTCYAHNTSFSTSAGAHVSQGQVIAISGCTGHCFGPHVHFEVRVNGAPVDPLGYL
jgi:murein DD-endopeptidase MepM/ murein hydrolase activator NlpD